MMSSNKCMYSEQYHQSYMHNDVAQFTITCNKHYTFSSHNVSRVQLPVLLIQIKYFSGYSKMT